MPSNEEDRIEFHFPTLARNRRPVRILIIERVGKKACRQFLANVVGEMERKCVGVMPKPLVDVAQHLSVDRIQINRDASNCVAAAIKIAEHMST